MLKDADMRLSSRGIVQYFLRIYTMDVIRAIRSESKAV